MNQETKEKYISSAIGAIGVILVVVISINMLSTLKKDVITAGCCPEDVDGCYDHVIILDDSECFDNTTGQVWPQRAYNITGMM